MPEWLSHLLPVVVLLGLWCVWWLFAVEWQKAWPVLARGGWAPIVLLVLVIAYAWSQISPGGCTFGFVRLAHLWAHLAAVGGLTLLALFCGWLQGYMHWAPAEVPIEPPGHGSAAHGHGHH
jgi:hypothetical protein